MHKTEPNNVRINVRTQQVLHNDRTPNKETYSGNPHGSSRNELKREELIMIARSNDLYERQSI